MADGRRIKTVIRLLLTIAVLVSALTEVYADSVREVRYALNASPENQLAAYSSAFGWGKPETAGQQAGTPEEIFRQAVESRDVVYNPYGWLDDEGEFRYRLTTGFQQEAFEDQLKSILAQLNLDIPGFEDTFDMTTGNESNIGLIGGGSAYYFGNFNMKYIAPGYAGKIVRKAKAEQGYGESEDGSVKYNTELGFESDSPWAACFISWLFSECGYSDLLGKSCMYVSELYFCLSNAYGSYPNTSVTQLGGSGYQAVPGDIVFWADDSDNDISSYIHCGIITTAETDSIKVTQGNTLSGKVAEIKADITTDEYLARGFTVHIPYPKPGYGAGALGIITGYCMDTLGLSYAATCGILGNLMVESGFDPTRLENTAADSPVSALYTEMVDNGDVTERQFVNTQGCGCYCYNGLYLYGNGGYGICQWTFYSRKQGLYDYAKACGTSIGDLTMQLEYMTMELSGQSYNNTLGYLQSLEGSLQDAYDACRYWQQNYERGTNFDARWYWTQYYFNAGLPG